jgi:hypothetical protein
MHGVCCTTLFWITMGLIIIGGLEIGDIDTSDDVPIIENDYSYNRATH